MRRRDVVAGIASLGALTGSGALLYSGVPSLADGSSGEPDDDDESSGPVEIETIDARGSDAGTVPVPSDRVTVATFFVTGCGQCQAQIPKLAAAHEDLVDDGTDVRFLSVTYQSVGQLPADELRNWWTSHEGNWSVGYDPDSTLSVRYGVVGYPVTVVIDADGESHWKELGVHSAPTITDAIDSVLATK